MTLHEIDVRLINFFKKAAVPTARFGLFVIYFWFGFLKLIGLSPAGPLVESLFHQTISFMPFSTFYMIFAIYEMIIGILFLIRGAERIVMPLLLLHMITTFMPLVLLPQITWQAMFVPTLEGQYIIKNLALIASAIAIAANLAPLRERKK